MRHWLIAGLLVLTGCPDLVEVCNNNVDDNGNGKIDCDDTDFCSDDPTCSVVCGNDRIDAGEVCDGAQLNGQSCFSLGQGSGTLSCNSLCLFDTSQCTPNAVCGNGQVEAGESCDDNNANNGDGCDNNCTATGCGNNIITAGEQCDDGNNTNGDGCSSICQNEGAGGFCGDGSIDAGEQCDDGNGSDTDSCPDNLGTCQNARCGDGFVLSGTEQCDDGNTTPGDGCENNCTITQGGNNICTAPQTAVVGANSGDNSNNANFIDPSCQDPDTADAVFRFTPTTTSINLSLSSVGDQGMIITNACTANATEIDCIDNIGAGVETGTLNNLTIGTPIFIFVGAFSIGEEGPFTLTISAGGGAVCGNSTVEAGEQCDDGNNVNTDSCVACQNAKCGDGFVRAGTEQCDDGNTSSGDGCSSTCTTEGGGAGQLQLVELDYDQVGTDNKEFIEIKNVGNAAVDLTKFELVLMNGNGAQAAVEYFVSGTTRLSLGTAKNAAGATVTSLPPGGLLVIATTTVTINANALRIIVGAQDNFQNGETATFSAAGGDAIGISDTSTGLLVDKISYEGNITDGAGLDFTGIGGVGLDNFQFTGNNEATNTLSSGSLIRIGNSGTQQNDWQATDTPTPGQ